MDALAGYGSDSTISSKSEVSIAHATDKDSSPKTALSVAKVKNDSSSSVGTTALESIAHYPDNDNDKDQGRQKRLCMELTPCTSLPPPPLLHSEKPSQDLSSDNLVLFKNDYFSKLTTSTTPSPSLPSPPVHLSQKLETMYNQFVKQHSNVKNRTTTRNSSSSRTKSNFANNLRSKKEFGNPALFPSIVTHFGINAGGSNIVLPAAITVDGDESSSLASASSLTFKRFEYVERLMANEEKERMALFERQCGHQQSGN